MESKYLAIFAVFAVVLAIVSSTQASPAPTDHQDAPLQSNHELDQQPGLANTNREGRFYYGGYPIGGGIGGAAASASASASAGGVGYGGYPLLYGK